MKEIQIRSCQEDRDEQFYVAPMKAGKKGKIKSKGREAGRRATPLCWWTDNSAVGPYSWKLHYRPSPLRCKQVELPHTPSEQACNALRPRRAACRFMSICMFVALC